VVLSDKSLAARLQIKPGNTVYVFEPPEGYAELLGSLPTGARLVDSPDGADVVQLFFSTLAELTSGLPGRLSDAFSALLWVSYPRRDSGRSDLSRQVVHNAIRLNGWKPVAQINIDETWTSIRARPA
jgi:hypothetical protein